MKNIKMVKLEDFTRNPHRSFEVYPIREDKVLHLMESIRATTFWGGLVGREREGKVEIAFGHHRVEALRKLFPPDAEFAVTIEDFSDEAMSKIMGLENDEDWACPIAAIDDAVGSARNYLTKHRDKVRDLLSSGDVEDKRLRIGARVIAKFMCKKEWTVRLSLERLNLVESGKVDREALYMMPSASAATRFAQAVTAYLRTSTPEDQRRMAKRIVETQRFGERSIIETVIECSRVGQREVIEPDRANYLELLMRKAIRQIVLLRQTLAKLTEPRYGTFTERAQTTEDIPAELIESYNRSVIALSDAFEKLGKELSESRPAGPRPPAMLMPEPEPSDDEEEEIEDADLKTPIPPSKARIR